MIRLLLKGILGFLLLGILVVGGYVLSDWRYFQRLLTFDRSEVITGVDWFEPVVHIAPGGAAALARATPAARTVSDEALTAALDLAIETKSVALLIWHKEALQLEYYAQGYGPTSITNSASMHKSVLALLIGIAVDKGFIRSIDEPAAIYLPEWAEDARAKITIRNLLQMSSGLGRPELTFSPLSDYMKQTLGTDISRIALHYPAQNQPNTAFSYGNLNSQLLGIILERASGMAYAEFLETFLWQKIAATPARLWLDRPSGMPRTFTGFFATAEDWLRLGLLHLNRGRVEGDQVVSESWMQQIVTPAITNPQYGFQTWLGTTWTKERGYGEGVSAKVRHDEPFASPDVIYFDGSGGQRVYIVPSQQLVIVRTGLGGMDFNTGFFDWEESRLPNLVINGIKQLADDVL